MEKIPVGILGATGMVGQKFIELLLDHPYFTLAALGASEKSAGKPYCEATRWMMPVPLPQSISAMPVQRCTDPFPCTLLFSGLDSSVAGPLEETLARSGHVVISNSKNHRMHPQVPLVIPEVNASHLALLKAQPFPGHIVTNPNCSVIGIATVLKPLVDMWGVEKVHATTLQAISGAGYPGLASFDILDNVIPYISGEEEKIETEPLKILGTLKGSEIVPYPMELSAQCNRVAVMDGHLACLSVKLKRRAKAEEILAAWDAFPSLNTPLSPPKPIVYLHEESHPQPKLHRHLGKGMSIAVGRLRPCPLLDWRFVILSHNTIRGAAGCAILNAETLIDTYILV